MLTPKGKHSTVSKRKGILMRKKAKRIVTLMLIAAVGLGMTFGGIETASAASVPTPAKVNLTSATAVGQNTITIKWNWAKNATNYAVYRDGNCVMRTSTSARSFVQKGLKPGTRYGFKVRAYRTYKQKQWYNKKTKKWQASQPAKSIRGATRTVTAYKYGPYSVTRYATTAKPAPAVVTKTVTINGEKQTLTMGKPSKLKVFQVPGVPTQNKYIIITPSSVAYGSSVKGTVNGMTGEIVFEQFKPYNSSYIFENPTFNKNNAKYHLEKYGLNYWEAEVYDANVKVIWTLDGTEPKLGQADLTIDGKDYPFGTLEDSSFGNPVDRIKVRGTASKGNPSNIFEESDSDSMGRCVWIKVFNGNTVVEEVYQTIGNSWN